MVVAAVTAVSAAQQVAEPATLWSRADSSALPAAVKRNDKQEYLFLPLVFSSCSTFLVE
jgi:hypothetical protein